MSVNNGELGSSTNPVHVETNFADGTVTEAKLADGAVTGVKIDAAAFLPAVVTALDASTAARTITLTGAEVGDTVLIATNLSTPSNAAASFESEISVDDEIQQVDDDLDTDKVSILLKKNS